LSKEFFDATFVEVGIVDVSPRIVSKQLYPYASRMPGFSKLQRSKRLHKAFGKPWVSPEQFNQNIAAIDEQLSLFSRQVYYIEIAKPAHYFKQNVGDFSESVEVYNRIISQCVGAGRFIACWNGQPVPEFLLPDGHHLSKEGHLAVAEKCLARLRHQPFVAINQQ
jgi:hypothetical protein